MKPVAPIPYSADLETIPSSEPEIIQRVVNSVKKLLAADLAKTGNRRSDVHVKTHGYANGELRVLPNLPDELAQGLFAAPQHYPVVVRFSNSANRSLPDIFPDGRGLAIKVKNVTGDWISIDEGGQPTQDFVLINHPVFFAADARDFQRLETVLEDTTENLLSASNALTGGSWNPLHWHWHEMTTAVEIAAKIPVHPANTTYYSMAPFRFGKYVAKFRVEPSEDRHDSYLEMLERLGTRSDAMRMALEATLGAEPLRFNFQVQLRNSLQTMPIEDATIQWPESESPFRTVAQLSLPKQDIAPNRHSKKYQNLAFNVWHAITAHRPLGGINRVRRAVYPISAAWRRQA